MLVRYYGPSAPQTPEPVLYGLRCHVLDARRQMAPPRVSVELGQRRLTLGLHQQIGEGEGDNAAAVDWWVLKGKIDRDIVGILGASPAVVIKHLERVHTTLGIETRTAAAGMAMNRIKQ